MAGIINSAGFSYALELIIAALLLPKMIAIESVAQKKLPLFSCKLGQNLLKYN